MPTAMPIWYLTGLRCGAKNRYRGRTINTSGNVNTVNNESRGQWRRKKKKEEEKEERRNLLLLLRNTERMIILTRPFEISFNIFA